MPTSFQRPITIDAMPIFDNLDRYMLSRMSDLLNGADYETPSTSTFLITNGDNKPVSLTTAGPHRGMLNAKLDLLEKPDSFVFNVELPGVKKEDIQVHVENGMLSVMAERRDEHKEEKDRYHVSERRYGSIKRIVSLPEQADADNVKADFDCGVLSLSFAKKPENASRKQIAIQ